MKILSKFLLYSVTAASALIFSNCNDPKYPDPVPHPEATPKGSTQLESVSLNSDCTLTAVTQPDAEENDLQRKKNSE